MIAGGTHLLGCIGVCFFLLETAGGAASGAGFTVTLAYDSGPGCPDAAAFKAAVIARLGHDPFSNSAPGHVIVGIAPRDGSLGGHIEWRDSKGRWAGEQSFPLVTNDCLRLVRAMGFALAVQIQLLETTRAASPPPVPAPSETAPRAEPPRPPLTPVVTISANKPVTVSVAASAAPPPAARPVFAMGAGPSVGFGMASSPLVLGRVFAALLWPRVSIELAAEAGLPATTRRPDGAGLSQQHLLGSAAACAAVRRWNGCLLAKAGEVRMVGEDIDRPGSAWVPVLEAGVRVGATQRLGDRILLNPRVDGLINLTRWTGSLDNIPVWTAPRFAAAIGVDAGVRFP